MSMKKRYIFLAVFLFCVAAVLGIFLYRFLTVDETSLATLASDSKITFEWLIEPQFYDATDFHSGVAWVQEVENGLWKLVDKTGKTIVENFEAKKVDSIYDPNIDLFSFVNLDGLGGYVDTSGDISIPAEYRFVRFFKQGQAAVAKETDSGLCHGVIDYNGNIVLPMVYEFISVIQKNVFVTIKDKKWGYINQKGEGITAFDFDGLYESHFPANVFLGVFDGKSGLLNEKGQWILSPVYDKAYGGDDGPVGLAKKGKVGFVDTKGNTIIDFQFPAFLDQGGPGPLLYSFSEGLAVVLLSKYTKETRNERAVCGVIDKQGKVLFEFRGIPGSYFSQGLMLIRSAEDSDELIDRSGNRYPLPDGVRAEVFAGRIPSEKILRVKMRKNVDGFEKGQYGYLKINVN